MIWYADITLTAVRLMNKDEKQMKEESFVLFFSFLLFSKEECRPLTRWAPCTANGSFLFPSPQVFLTPEAPSFPGGLYQALHFQLYLIFIQNEELQPSIYPFLCFCSFFPSRSSFGALHSQCLRAISYALNWEVWQKPCDSVISWATEPLVICLWELY